MQFLIHFFQHILYNWVKLITKSIAWVHFLYLVRLTLTGIGVDLIKNWTKLCGIQGFLLVVIQPRFHKFSYFRFRSAWWHTNNHATNAHWAKFLCCLCKHVKKKTRVIKHMHFQQKHTFINWAISVFSFSSQNIIVVDQIYKKY